MHADTAVGILGILVLTVTLVLSGREREAQLRKYQERQVVTTHGTVLSSDGAAVIIIYEHPELGEQTREFAVHDFFIPVGSSVHVSWIRGHLNETIAIM